MQLIPLVASLAFLAVATAASAQDNPGAASCPQGQEIVAVADYLLLEPAEVGRFWRDRQASDAAYAKLRYGGIGYREGRELLRMLGERRRTPGRWLELSLAQASAQDRATQITTLEPEAGAQSVLPQLGESVWRAMIRDDGGAWIVSEMRAWQSAQPNAPQMRTVRAAIARSAIGLPGDRQQEFAKRAEVAGLPELAYHVYAQQPDLAEVSAFFSRAPDAFLVHGEGDRDDTRTALLRNAIVQLAATGRFDQAIQSAEVKAIAAGTSSVALLMPLGRLASQAPETLLLATVLNQTGKHEVSTLVAAGLLDDIAAKRLDPDRHPDAVVAAMVQRLDQVLGKAERERTLASFDVAAGFAGDSRTAQAYTDEAIARDALAPLVAGSPADVTPNERPAEMSAAFDWQRWTAVAETLQKGEPVQDPDRPIAASLLAAAGKPEDALAVLKSATDWQVARNLAHALLTRLDRGCAKLLKPETAYYEALYRFDP
jgi:hypothetical protein